MFTVLQAEKFIIALSSNDAKANAQNWSITVKDRKGMAFEDKPSNEILKEKNKKKSMAGFEAVTNS